MLEWNIYFIVTIIVVAAIVAAIVFFVRSRLRKDGTRRTPQGPSKE